MQIRKIAGTGLAALIFALGITAVPYAPVTANAEDGALVLTTENAELFLPESYEEYLSLENPSYMAMSERFIAISDATRLYVYNRAETVYSCYDASALTNGSDISKLQISDDERLFFSAGIRLYEYDFEIGEAKIVSDVPCNTFLVEGEYLYTSYIAANSQVSLSRYPLSDLSPDTEVEITTVPNVSTYSKLTTWDGILYCVRNDRYIVAYDMSKMSHDASGQFGGQEFVDRDNDKLSDIQRVCAYNGYLYYSVYGDGAYPNGLYRSDFKGNAECVLKGNGYSAITTYRGNLYCIKDSSVLRLNVTDEGVGFSGYEIASSSSSVNRLMNAVDSVRAGALLVTADSAARRVSVYNLSTAEYSVIDCDFTPSLVATDGSTIAVASSNNVYVCSYGDDEFTLGKTMQSEVKGIACVYGNVYVVTENNYGKVGENEVVWHSNGTPKRMTRDIYGNIYVAYTSGAVYAFTEEEFLSAASNGMRLDYTFSGLTVMRADFEGNLYYLSGGTLYKNGETFATINGSDFVYDRDGTAAKPTNFALGFEDSEVYFFFGDYAVKSKADALDIPTLDKISTEGAAQDAFSVHGHENLLVTIPANTVGIITDLAEFREEDSQYFPYVDYHRITKERQGVLLAETSRYMLVLLPYDKEDDSAKGYKAYLFHSNEDYLVDESEYWTETTENYYISKEIYSYFAPCLETALAGETLARGIKVETLGFVSAPDYEYALIRYTDNARTVFQGFVPKTFLTKVSPLPVSGDEYFTAWVKGNAEGITFTAANGETITVTERTEASACGNEDGTYTVWVERDGVRYYASLEEKQLEYNNSEALRIALIIILTVLALVIIGVYVYFLPRTTRETVTKQNKKTKKK